MKRTAPAFCLAAFVASGVAFAQTRPSAPQPPNTPTARVNRVEELVSLDWTAPVECSTRERVLADVSQMIRAGDRPLGTSAERKVVARVLVVTKRAERGDDAYVVEIKVDGGDRRLEGPRCEPLVAAAAFIIALAIDPSAQPLATSAAGNAGAATPAPGPATADNAKPQGPSEPTKKPDEPDRPDKPKPPTPVAQPGRPAETPRIDDQSEKRFHVAVQAALDFASMPKPSVGPMAAFGARLAPVRVEAFGAYFFEQTTSLPIPGPPIGARVTGWVVGARAALPFRAGIVEGGPQIGVVAHVLDATAYGAVSSAEGSANWAGALLGGTISLRLHPNLALRADVQGDLALSRPEFVIDEAGSVHRPPTLSGCAAIGPELRFF